MSDASQGPGWWLASDGKWYPPELWTGPPDARPGPGPGDAQPNVPAYPSQAPSYGGTGWSGAPGQPGAPSPYASGPFQPSGYGQPAPYGVPAKRKTNGLAIASLVCSCAGIFLLGIPAVLGIIFGFVARGQIRGSQGAQGGGGLALAGIIVGFGVVALLVIVFAVAGHSNNNGNGVVHALLAVHLPG
jgi:hypothetical protein